MQTIETASWQNCALSVTAHLVPRYLWTTASIDVFLDNQCILQTGGQMKLNGYYSSNFTHSGQTHVAVLSWGTGVFMSFPYTLQIDGVLVQQGKVRVQNWILGLLLPLIAVVFTVAAFYLMNELLKTLPHQ